jgi:hypothetical protein
MKIQNGKDNFPKFSLYSLMDTVYQDIHVMNIYLIFKEKI